MIRLRLTGIDAAGAGVIAALSAGVYFGVVTPAAQRQSDVADDRARLEEVEQALVKTENQRREAEAQVARLDELIRDRRITLEPVSALNERIAAISALATEQGVNLVEIRSGSPEPLGAVIGVPVHLAGSARYDAMTRFVHTLHERFPDVAVRSLELVGTPTEPGSTASFKAYLKWRAAPSSAGTGSAGSAGSDPTKPR